MDVVFVNMPKHFLSHPVCRLRYYMRESVACRQEDVILACFTGVQRVVSRSDDPAVTITRDYPPIKRPATLLGRILSSIAHPVSSLDVIG